MEVIEDRAERGSTLIATQIPLKQWHEADWRPKPGRRYLRSHSPQRAPHHSQRSFSEKDQGCAKAFDNADA